MEFVPTTDEEEAELRQAIFFKELTSEQLVYDTEPPTPEITSISDEGLVKIRFNTTMEEGVLLTDEEVARLSSRRRRRRLVARHLEVEASDDEIVTGKAASDYSNFSKIHSGSVSIDGIVMPSLGVSIEPAEPDNTSNCAQQLDFKWEVVDYTVNELTLQLYFDWPNCVSSTTSEGDYLVVAFNDQSLFRDRDGRLVKP